MILIIKITYKLYGRVRYKLKWVEGIAKYVPVSYM